MLLGVGAAQPWARFVRSLMVETTTVRSTMSMLDWNTYHKQVLSRVGEIGRISPDVVKGYQMLAGAAGKTGVLGAKVNEPIALAVAVTVRCDGCIAVHTAAAIRAGAMREEIAGSLRPPL